MSQVAASSPCVTCAKPVFEDQKYCPTCGTPVVRLNQSRRAEIVRNFASGAMQSAGETALHLMRKKQVQKIAGGAALGAGAAIVVPLVSISAGAALGAAYAGYKLLTKD